MTRADLRNRISIISGNLQLAANDERCHPILRGKIELSDRALRNLMEELLKELAELDRITELANDFADDSSVGCPCPECENLRKIVSDRNGHLGGLEK